ncbi:hypothetical protein PILCRDRAFT_815998 [Piloderma croceum F 1598]|uniref:WW domain-containing protein n=1 Tax=Piloderma croceum (strain F 1598) TaxID=765440 RepID=A0A0C3G7W9_PILCF|nr:hypothetical protein PILCRDRAFT_815998 [Piloderma croceum F 1598]
MYPTAASAVLNLDPEPWPHCVQSDVVAPRYYSLNAAAGTPHNAQIINNSCNVHFEGSKSHPGGHRLFLGVQSLSTMETLVSHHDSSDSPGSSEFYVKNLIPITTLQISRYYKPANVTLSHMVIDPGLLVFAEGSQPMYLPPDWAAFTHPEGKPYFCRNAGLRVVTEAYLYHPEIMNKVSFWTSSLETAFQKKGMKLPTTTELFLEPRDDMESCGYYLVDHATRTEFWINPVSTASLGVGRVTSISHLKTALEQLYWAHVEFFPMHLDCISYDIIEQLISVFAHGQTDRMTSSTSTFPYDINRCMNFIQLLTDARERGIDGYTRCLVARMWHNIVSSRFLHHFGQESPRLDSNQAILGQFNPEDHRLFRLCTPLCFGLPDFYYSHLSEIYVDCWINKEGFCDFVFLSMDEWTSSLSLSLNLLMANVLILSMPAASSLIGLSAIIMSGMSAIFATILCTRNKDFDKATVDTMFNSLKALRSDTYGFRLAALVFSLPRALCLWSLGLLITQTMSLTFRLLDLHLAIGVATIVLFVLMGTGSIAFPQDYGRFCRMLANWSALLRGYGQILLRRRR